MRNTVRGAQIHIYASYAENGFRFDSYSSTFDGVERYFTSPRKAWAYAYTGDPLANYPTAKTGEVEIK